VIGPLYCSMEPPSRPSMSSSTLTPSVGSARAANAYCPLDDETLTMPEPVIVDRLTVKAWATGVTPSDASTWPLTVAMSACLTTLTYTGPFPLTGTIVSTSPVPDGELVVRTSTPAEVTAALVVIVNPPAALQEQYERINVGGTSTVVAAAVQAGVGRVAFFSTIAVYGPSHGKILTEDTPSRPDTFYARTKLAAEKIVLEAKGADGGPIGVVLRLGAVYGSGIKGNYQRLVQSLAKGCFIPVGDGSNRRSLVYDRDVAQAAVLAAAHPDAAGRIYNVTDGEFHTMKDIIATLCHALGRRPPAFALPLPPVRWAAGLLEESSKIVHLRSPMTRETITKYTEDMAVDGQRIRKELGFTPRYDLSHGWKETVQEMRQAGIL